MALWKILEMIEKRVLYQYSRVQYQKDKDIKEVFKDLLSENIL